MAAAGFSGLDVLAMSLRTKKLGCADWLVPFEAALLAACAWKPGSWHSLASVGGTELEAEALDEVRDLERERSCSGSPLGPNSDPSSEPDAFSEPLSTSVCRGVTQDACCSCWRRHCAIRARNDIPPPSPPATTGQPDLLICQVSASHAACSRC